MKFIANTTLLNNAIAKVKGVANNKSTHEPTKYLLFKTDGANTLKISASDLDMFATVSIPCEVVERGAVCLLAKKVEGLVKGLRGEETTIQREDNDWGLLRCGKSRARIPGLHADNFPQMQEIDDSDTFSLDTEMFQGMISKTLFCVSTDESRTNLTGAFFKVGKDGLQMVATDGHRMSIITDEEAIEEWEAPSALVEGVIIPRAAMVEIKRAFDHKTCPTLAANVRENRITFFAKDFVLSSALVDANYPDFLNVLGGRHKHTPTITIRRAAIEGALKYLSAAIDKSRKLSLDVKSGGPMGIHVKAYSQGEADELVDCDYDGPDVLIAIDHKYISEALGVTEGDEVTMQITDSLSPVIIRDGGTPGMMLVVMPIRL